MKEQTYKYRQKLFFIIRISIYTSINNTMESQAYKFKKCEKCNNCINLNCYSKFCEKCGFPVNARIYTKFDGSNYDSCYNAKGKVNGEKQLVSNTYDENTMNNNTDCFTGGKIADDVLEHLDYNISNEEIYAAVATYVVVVLVCLCIAFLNNDLRCDKRGVTKEGINMSMILCIILFPYMYIIYLLVDVFTRILC
jgi:hypothetical protein